ncbi:hypothetical protein BN1184_AB_00050 [Pantoea ananatis]|nr:hypothetical protein BN1184_AB_00050 [Pantoea ananatis]
MLFIAIQTSGNFVQRRLWLSHRCHRDAWFRPGAWHQICPDLPF